MAPFSVIVLGVVVWRIAVSGAKQLRFQLVWTGPTSTERANDRLITVHASFLAIAPNQNATLQFVLCTIHYVRTIVADCVGLFFWRRDENEILFGNSQKYLRQ